MLWHLVQIELEMSCSLISLVNYNPSLVVDLMDDEEEILLALAEVLGGFLEYIGGPAHTVHVLKPLEKLCQVEESTVRDKVP